MSIIRDFDTSEIVIKWRDDVIGDIEKRFPFDLKIEAMEFAEKEFNQICM